MVRCKHLYKGKNRHSRIQPKNLDGAQTLIMCYKNNQTNQEDEDSKIISNATNIGKDSKLSSNTTKILNKHNFFSLLPLYSTIV